MMFFGFIAAYLGGIVSGASFAMGAWGPPVFVLGSLIAGGGGVIICGDGRLRAAPDA